MTFARPFKLTGVRKPFAAGTYDVETEEEQLDGVSFPAFRRLQTYLTQRGTASSSPALTTHVVDLDELTRACEEQQGSNQQD